MHPYIEIVFSMTLILLGFKMLRKLLMVRYSKFDSDSKSYVATKYKRLLSRKLSIRLWIMLFVLILVITSMILIEKGQMSVSWSQ